VPTFQGSRGHLLDLIDRPGWRDELNGILGAVGATIPSDSAHVPAGSVQPREWNLVKFLQEHCITAMDVDRFSTWWVRQGAPPTWDLISQCLIDDRPGILLVEAKAHENELSSEGKLITFRNLAGSPQDVMSRIARSLVNHGYIGRCIDEARDGLRRFIPVISIDRDRNYQLSNRIASTWKVADCGMPAVLLYLGFTGDQGMASQGVPLRDKNHWDMVVRSHLRDLDAERLIDTNVVLANGCPLRFCIGDLGARRQSSIGNG